MERETERQLMRWLAGELEADEARRLRDRLAKDPVLAREAERLRRTWSALEEPAGAVPPVPAGFSGRVMARVREEAAPPRLSWSAAPGWARAASAAALVAGLFLGAGLGGLVPGDGVPGGGVLTDPVPAEGAGEAVPGAPGPATAPGGAVADLPASAAGEATPTAGATTPAAEEAATRLADAGATPDVAAETWQDLYYGEGYGEDDGTYGASFGSLGATYAAALSSLGDGEGT